MSNAYLKFYYDNVIGLLSKESLQLVYVDTLPAPAALDLRNRILYIRNIDETEELEHDDPQNMDLKGGLQEVAFSWISDGCPEIAKNTQD